MYQIPDRLAKHKSLQDNIPWFTFQFDQTIKQQKYTWFYIYYI